MSTRFANNTTQLTNVGPAAGLAHPDQRIVSLQNPGQNGYLTDLTFSPSATDYIANPLIIKVLRTPGGFGDMDTTTANQYRTAWINLLESLMQRWEGFNRTLTVGTAETQIGRSNEVFHTPTRVSRARSNVTSQAVEKYGRPIIRLVEDSARLLIQDPDVGHALLSGISETYNDALSDKHSFDILAFQPDRTHKYVENAWLMTNFFMHQELGENIGQRVLQEDGDVSTYSFTWAGTQKVGYAVDALAQRFMDSAKVTGIDPGFQPNPIQGMTADAAAATVGGLQQINDLKEQMQAVRQEIAAQ